tara:strand:+ start:32690 stop:33055 length:366 start_codon:yes stop_codon:yes gene_type:complete
MDAAKPPPPLGATTFWDHLDLVNLARAEIDNTARLLDIIEANPGAVIDMAPERYPETIMRFSSTLADHLQRKIRTMNSKWADYDRLSQPANPRSIESVIRESGRVRNPDGNAGFGVECLGR